MKKDRWVLLVFAFIIGFRIAFFCYTVISAPEAKFQPDSNRYITTAQILYSDHVFAREKQDDRFVFEDFRTPGYPFFLAVFHNSLKLPLDGIVFLQNMLTFLTAFFVYKSSVMIDRRFGVLSAFVILFDPNILVYNYMIMTESLCMFLISVFMYLFLNYINNRSVKLLVLSALIIAGSVYVRPIGYYLGAALSLYILFLGWKERRKRQIAHACAFFLVVYCLVGAWQIRNKHHFGRPFFTILTEDVIPDQGLYKSYNRNIDPATKGLPPAAYYINVATRSSLSFLTRPGSFKYFKSASLTIAGKIISYPWIFIWVCGLLIGIIKFNNKRHLVLFLLMILYFMAASVAGGLWGIGSRFRIPVMPCIAVLTACGWVNIAANKKKKRL